MRPLVLAFLIAAPGACAAPSPAATSAAPPNVVFILADDLGYGDLGCYGQKLIRTPRIDRMAAEGLRFTQFYAGSTVCAPSRSVLMTGQHAGRTWVRGNGSLEAQTLREQDVTVAERLKSAGYATGLFGKWGLGEEGSTGHPNRQGFDAFFGYLSQRHAHNYFPPFLIRNEERVPLRNVPADDPRAKQPDGSGWSRVRLDYSHDLIAEEAFRWVREHRAGPFFLYLAVTLPHANNEGTRGTGNGAEVPDLGEYAKESWPQPDQGQASMVSRLDRDVGRLLDLLRELDIEGSTLVLFSSDNGPHKEAGNNPDLFDANGPLRGLKRSLTEGGIRVPLIARWPGRIAPGVSDHAGYFGDFMATACELAAVEPPRDVQSLSLVPILLGRPAEQKTHSYLYWEFYEQGSRQAVRFDRWKAIRQPMHAGPIEIYDLAADVGEATDLAKRRPELVARAEALFREAHVPNPNWKAPPAK